MALDTVIPGFVLLPTLWLPLFVIDLLWFPLLPGGGGGCDGGGPDMPGIGIM